MTVDRIHFSILFMYASRTVDHWAAYQTATSAVYIKFQFTTKTSTHWLDKQ